MVRQGSGSIGLLAPFGRVFNSLSFFKGRVFWVQVTMVCVFTAVRVVSVVVSEISTYVASAKLS